MYLFTDLLCSDSNPFWPTRCCHPCKLVDEQKSLNVIWLVGEDGNNDESWASIEFEWCMSFKPLRWCILKLVKRRFKNWIDVKEEEVWISKLQKKKNKMKFKIQLSQIFYLWWTSVISTFLSDTQVVRLKPTVFPICLFAFKSMHWNFFLLQNSRRYHKNYITCK
jgi:hypothetical protein